VHFASLLNSINWNLINSLLSLFCVTAGIPTVVTVPICREVGLMYLLIQYTAFNTNFLLMWARFIWRRHWKVLVHCSVVNIRYLPTIFKGGWNCFLWPTNNYDILQTCWLLHIQVLLKKLKTLHPEWYFWKLFSVQGLLLDTFIFVYASRVKTTWVQICKHGGHNSLLILLTQNPPWKQRIACGVSCCGIFVGGGGVYVFL